MLTFRCAGCGAVDSGPLAVPFACRQKRAGDDIDHVVCPATSVSCPFPHDSDTNPFVRYRTLLASYALARGNGVTDSEFVQMVRELDDAVARVDGRRYTETPFSPARGLAERLGFGAGELWVKDETGNVSGSHKGRHLAGIMLSLLGEARKAADASPDSDGTLADSGATRVGLRGAAGRPPLAIASCGNAALAAAVVARASGWPLEVFVPPSASAKVMDRLRQLSAIVHVCHRQADGLGDPCYRAFREAVEHGAIPFCCQGSDNGLTIDGGKTIAWEMANAFRSRPNQGWGAGRLDALFVQVGGGTLASALVQGFEDAVRSRGIERGPRIYAVQTTGAYPLKRAFDRVADRVLARLPVVVSQGFSPAADRERAELILSHPEVVDEQLHYARTHRSEFMRPWEKPPVSIAHGILDDETYDWASVVEGMLKSGGWPLVVSEQRLSDANALAREATGIDVCHTGSAGLAGLMKAMELDRRLAAERVAVIFSGARRA